MVDVTLWGGLVPLAENQKHLQVEARTIRELIDKLSDRYPGMRDPLANQVAVVVNGVVYRDDRSQKIPADAEVFLMRRLAGG